MSDSYYGTLYLLAPGEPYDREHLDEHVVEARDNARSHLDVARELWSLAGDEAKANAIADIIDHAYDRDIPIFLPQELDELVALIDGLEEALMRTIVDDDLHVRPEHMAHVRQHARLIDVGDDRGALARNGVMEGLSRAWAVRNILCDARTRGLDVALA